MNRAMQVLMYDRSFARVRASLERHLPDVEPLLMSKDGSLALVGTASMASHPIAPADAAPVAAWANSDLYDGGPARDFMVLCLKSRSLRWLQSGAAGFDHPVFSSLVDNGVALSTSNASAIAIAEYVLAAVLGEYQPQQQRRELQRDRRWQRVRFREVAGTTWLVIGVGNIGSEVATRARAFGATVIGVRRTPRGDEPVDRMIAPAAVPDALPACDVVVLCAPANPESAHLVDAAFLSRLKTGSLLVNISRGALIDEAALLASLERGVPECAVLDVFETEPLPESSPLWSHPRVRVSAHDAAGSDGYVGRSDALFLSNLQRFAAGEAPLHLADPAVVKRSVLGQQR
jgi:phosphoglycerate dehydrogenase-like enzyme